MKGLLRFLKTPLIFCLIGLLVIILNVLPTEADQGNITVQELVEQKKGELNHFVEVVQANSQNCGTYLTCTKWSLFSTCFACEFQYHFAFDVLGLI